MEDESLSESLTSTPKHDDITSNKTIYSQCRNHNRIIISSTTNITSFCNNYQPKENILSNFSSGNIDKHLLDIIYKNTPNGIILYDKNGNLLNLNDKNREIMGIPKSANLNHVNLFKEPNLSKENIQMLKQGRDISFDLEYNFNILDNYFESANTQLKNLRITIIVIKNNNNIGGYLLINQDITSIKINERLLKENNEKLSFTLKNSGMIIWEYDCLSHKFSSSKGFENKAELNNDTFEYYRKYVSDDSIYSYDKVYNIFTNQKNESFQVEAHLINLQNEDDMYITFYGKPYRYNEKGDVISYLGYRKNITTDKILLNRLQHSVKKNKLILDNVGIGLAYMDLNFNVIWKNSAFNELYERDINDEKIIGHQCYKAIYQKSEPCENCIIKSVFQSGETKTVHKVKTSHDVYNITGVPVKNSLGQMLGTIIRIDKITNEYNAKKEAESLARMLQVIIDNLPLGLYIKDINDDYKYIIANKSICEFSRMNPDECIGKSDYDILDKDIADMFRKEDEDIVRKYRETHVPIIKKKQIMWGGEEKCVKTINIVAKHEDGKDILISAALDETERETMLKELQIEKEHAEESDRLKSAFLANMSHEIRTPLNAIIGFSEIITTNENKEENEEYLKIIQRNNQILLRLINDILDLSKFDAGAVKLQNKEFDLAELDSNFKAFYDNNKLDNSIEFITDLPYKKCIVNLDEQRFIQVCNNFITNAIKYTNKGYIKYGYLYENHGIKMYVKDTGCGIPKESHNKLFTRFGKVNDFIQGNGLGLTICKAILDMQKGKIGFDSEEGKGSTFWAWFPTNAEVEAKMSNDDINKPKANPTSKCQNEEHNKSALRILVAEDNDSNYLLLKTLLKGYNLKRAKDGIEAVEMTKQNRFDIIMMDIKMPRMNGLEATKQIREFNKDVVIIATTASAFDCDLKAEKEAGCDEVLTKPITLKGREFLFKMLNSFE